MSVAYHYELSQHKLHWWLVLLFIECSTHVAIRPRRGLYVMFTDYKHNLTWGGAVCQTRFTSGIIWSTQFYLDISCFLSVTVILLVWYYMCVFDLVVFAQLYSMKELIGYTQREKNRLFFCNTHYSGPQWPPSYILI